MVRPRLTDLEIKFLIESLKHTLNVLDIKEREFKELDSKVWRLRKEARYNTGVWKELKEAKEQLEELKGLPRQLLNYRTVCNNMIRRFESLLKGGRLHSRNLTDYYLDKMFGTKKA